MQKSQSLLLPSLKLDKTIYRYLVSTYCGNKEYEGEDSWGKFFYLLLQASIPDTELNKLRAHSWYETEYDPTDKEIMIVFKPDIESRKKLFIPFVNGKYSEMDKYYVHSTFGKKNEIGERNLNWKVCNKDPKLKAYWEERIGITLPDSAEVWSAPKKEDEIYNYENQNISLGVQLHEYVC